MNASRAWYPVVRLIDLASGDAPGLFIKGLTSVWMVP